MRIPTSRASALTSAVRTASPRHELPHRLIRPTPPPLV